MKTIRRLGNTLALLVVALFLFQSSVLAVSSTKTTTISPSPVAKQTPTQIEYVLPFPGILPTHPLYFLKNLRDKIIELLITDSISKAEFYLLQADKKLNMGVSLKALGKTEYRAVLTDALNSRTQAITLLEQYVKSGSTLPGYLIEKIVSSLMKHKEVLTELGEKVEGVEALLTRVQQMVQLAQ